jgi:hypothetical protein
MDAYTDFNRFFNLRKEQADTEYKREEQQKKLDAIQAKVNRLNDKIQKTQRKIEKTKIDPQVVIDQCAEDHPQIVYDNRYDLNKWGYFKESYKVPILSKVGHIIFTKVALHGQSCNSPFDVLNFFQFFDGLDTNEYWKCYLDWHKCHKEHWMDVEMLIKALTDPSDYRYNMFKDVKVPEWFMDEASAYAVMSRLAN